MRLAADGRLFVACSNDNTIRVIDTRTRLQVETISTTLTPKAPEGSTPDALAIDPSRHVLYVANADNNDVGVVDISNRQHSQVVGFIPTGWYPSALALSRDGRKLFVGNSKGQAAYPDVKGPTSPLSSKYSGDETIRRRCKKEASRSSMSVTLKNNWRHIRERYWRNLLIKIRNSLSREDICQPIHHPAAGRRGLTHPARYLHY